MTRPMGFFQWVMGLWARECTPLLTNPQRTTRTDDIFQIATRRTDVGKFSVVNRLMSNFNQYCNKKDILETKTDDFGLITTLIRTCFHNGKF